MNIRDLAILQSASARLDEFITACRTRGRLYIQDPALAADVTRKAKSLRTSLATLWDAIEDPDHHPGKESPMPKDPLSVRLYYEPPLYELARAIGYAGKAAEEMQPAMKELCQKPCREKMAAAIAEIATLGKDNRWALQPHVRKLCSQLLGACPRASRS